MCELYQEPEVPHSQISANQDQKRLPCRKQVHDLIVEQYKHDNHEDEMEPVLPGMIGVHSEIETFKNPKFQQVPQMQAVKMEQMIEVDQSGWKMSLVQEHETLKERQTQETMEQQAEAMGHQTGVSPMGRMHQ